jgi:hypothetical protein
MDKLAKQFNNRQLGRDSADDTGPFFPKIAKKRFFGHNLTKKGYIIKKMICI